MHDVIAFLKSAVSRGIAAGVGDCYVIDGETIRASNFYMHAGIRWPSKKAFAVPAQAVDDFLARVDSVQKIKIEENTITLQTGRLSSRINRRFEDPLPLPNMPTEWKPSPMGLTAALKMAQPFVGEGTGNRVYMTCIRLFQDRVTASSGQVIIDITVPGLGIERPKLLAGDVVDFLIAQGDPDEYGDDDNTITFRWEDGRWVRCNLVDSEFSEGIVQRIFNELVGKEAPVKFTPEWRPALDDAVAMADGVIGMNAAGFKAINKDHTSQVELKIDVPAGHESWWKGKDLQAVAAVAKSWNPGAYPDKPSLFLGDNLRGAISGHSKR